MTRVELLRIVIAQARSNGFEFRKWFVGRLGLPWKSPNDAVDLLVAGRHYYALLFSHEFAINFWKAGERMTIQLAQQSYPRRKADGTVGLVIRKQHTRRRTREDAWRYHLREMALQEEPLRYVRRFLRVEEELEPEIAIPKADPRFIVDEEDLLEDEED